MAPVNIAYRALAALETLPNTVSADLQTKSSRGRRVTVAGTSLAATLTLSSIYFFWVKQASVYYKILATGSL